mgnify:CR=1 FL=1
MERDTREKLLKAAKTEEDRLFAAKLLDKAERAGSGYLVFTRFMDPHQRTIARLMFREPGVRFVFDGGYAEAERAVAFLPPDYMVCDTEAGTLEEIRSDPGYPISVVRAGYRKTAYTRELTHRDYLGALMNLGVKRETLGDILVHGDFAQIIALSKIAQYIVNNLKQVGRTSVEVRKIELSELVPPVSETEEKTVTVASLRLDAVLAEGFGLSRSEASGYIEAGRVYLQFEECNNASRQVEEGNIISLRGMGRILLDKIGNKSRKNRIFITIKK